MTFKRQIAVILLLGAVSMNVEAKEYKRTKEGYSRVFKDTVKLDKNIYLYKVDSFEDYINLKFSVIQEEAKTNFLPVVKGMIRSFENEDYKGIWDIFTEDDSFEWFFKKHYFKGKQSFAKEEIYEIWVNDVKGCKEKTEIRFCELFKNREKFKTGGFDVLIIPNYIKDIRGKVIPEYILKFYDREILYPYQTYTEMYFLDGKYTFTGGTEGGYRIESYLSDLLWGKRKD